MMEKREQKERIKQAVRESYSKMATQGTATSNLSSALSCCEPPAISSPAETIDPCCEPGLTPEKISASMGYSVEEIQSVPEGANLGLGCGNPVAVASLKAGETVVDLGSGAGFDCFLAVKEVGETGHVIGVDMTHEMISKARSNAAKAGVENVEFRLGEIEHLPVADNTADLIMSNCVINLSPDKESVYSEAFRVLKPGGRLAISDILATTELPDEIKEDLNLISACIGGAETIANTTELLKNIGFKDIRITPKDESRDLLNLWAPDAKAGDYIVSANIESTKPK
ncbi:MAG: arsenite methyltransferase [bacterium]